MAKKVRKYIFVLIVKTYLNRVKSLFSLDKTKNSAQEKQDCSKAIFAIQVFFGKKPEQIKFLGRSKLGLNAYKFLINGKWFKAREFLYEKDAKRIKNIVYVLKQSDLDIVPFVGLQGNFIFLQWLSAKQINMFDFLRNPSLIEDLAKTQAKMHSIKDLQIENLASGKSYIEFLKQRFINLGKKVFAEQELRKIVVEIDKLMPELRKTITHPDFTDNNILISEQGMKIIDIESLNFDFGYEYDILNTAKFLFPNSKILEQHYISLYKKYNSVGTLETNAKYWDLIYLIRLIGSFLQRGDRAKAEKAIKEIKEKLNDK